MFFGTQYGIISVLYRVPERKDIMAHNRKDKRNRVLYKGEYQRANGMYEYRYTDAKGVARSVYSWRLKPDDSTPYGKEETPSLREMIATIERDKQDEIDTISARKTTLDDFFAEYIQDRPLKQSTRTNYKYMYKKYVSGVLGSKKLSSIKYSDIKRLYNSLIDEQGFKPNSMEVINTILHPIFDTAVRDDIIRKNPTAGVMAEIKARRDWNKPKRSALTVEQQGVFVDYLSQSQTYCHWKPLLTVLLGTGCRVGEVIGLRWDDCDFESGIININHNLIYRPQDNGKVEYHITTPKTAAGVRQIPMFDEVKEALIKEYEYQQLEGFNQTEIDGYSGFVFKNRFDTVYNPHCINRGIERIRRDYNAEETQRAKEESRTPVLLPHFTVHNLRHTFCSRLCENVSDQSTLAHIRDIMGHSTIDTTLDIYAELTTDSKKNAIASLQGKIKLA